jgi:hypothetical protein
MVDPSKEGKLCLLSYFWNLETRGVKEHDIYAVTVETPRPEQGWRTHLLSYLSNFKTDGARRSSCKQLLRKPRNPSRQGKPIYLVTFENWQPKRARNTSRTQLLRKSRKAQYIYAVIVETPRSGQERHTHFRISRGNLAMWAGKAHSFT